MNRHLKGKIEWKDGEIYPETITFGGGVFRRIDRTNRYINDETMETMVITEINDTEATIERNK